MEFLKRPILVIVLRWLSLYLTEKSALVQVMAWCQEQAIIWAKVDLVLCRHKASIGHELTAF